jgi:hypothetical protein
MKCLFIVITFSLNFVFTAFSQTCPTPPACTHTNQTGFTFSDGDVLCITTSSFNLGDLNGTIQAGQTATLYIAPGASVSIGNFNTSVVAGGTFNIINEGIWEQNNFTIKSHMVFNNCETGMIDVSGNIVIDTDGTLNNLGTVEALSGLNNNSNGEIYNSGLITINGDFNSDGAICGPDIGCGRFVVSGNSGNNANGTFGADSGNNDCGNLDLCSGGGSGFQNQSGTVGSGVSVCHPDAETGCGTILPVELISFQAKKQANNILITWQTTSETNNAYFLIERSFDGINFTTIGEIAGNGTISTIKKYDFVDTEAQEGLNYYRLNQVDYDGTSSLSKIITQKYISNLNLVVKIYPNPSYGREVYIKIENIKEAEEVKVKVYTAQGQEILNREILFQGDEIKIVEQLTNGVYFIELVTKEFNFKDVLIFN